MTPHEILVVLWDEGVLIRLAPDGKNLIATGARLRPCERNVVLANKRDLIEFLTHAHTTTVMLIAAAMRRCDEFNDGDQARADMRQQCMELPPHLQADLLDHFNGKRAH